MSKEKEDPLWYRKGQEYFKSRSLENVIECYQKAINLEINFTSPWKPMRKAYEKIGSY